MKISEKLKADILSLETENMAPILEAIGIKHDPEKLLAGLEKPQEIISIYKEEVLMALLRFSYQGENAFIWSIQIKHPAKNKQYLLPLLRKTRKIFDDLKIKTIDSVVQKSNIASIKFHKKLNFVVIEEQEKVLKFNLRL